MTDVLRLFKVIGDERSSLRQRIDAAVGLRTATYHPERKATFLSGMREAMHLLNSDIGYSVGRAAARAGISLRELGSVHVDLQWGYADESLSTGASTEESRNDVESTERAIRAAGSHDLPLEQRIAAVRAIAQPAMALEFSARTLLLDLGSDSTIDPALLDSAGRALATLRCGQGIIDNLLLAKLTVQTVAAWDDESARMAATSGGTA